MIKHLFTLLFFCGLTLQAQTTYVWNNPAGGNFNTPTNWTPNRSAPASDDILEFSDGGTYNVTNIPTQTIGQLKVKNGTKVGFNATTPNTLTISGGVGTDFFVEPGSGLELVGANAITLQIASGATAEIQGGIGASQAAHRFLTADPNSFIFKNGSQCIAYLGFSGNMFGNTGTPSTTIFEAGSEYIYRDGGNPFGLSAPNSKVVFQPNSKYIHQHNLNAPATAGRTYAIFELDHPSFNTNLTGTSPLNVQQFIVKQGNLRLGLTADVNVSEDILIISGTSERTSSGKLNVGGNFILSGGNFNYTGTGILTIGGNLEVQSITSTFNLYPILLTSRADVIGGNITNIGNIDFNPSVTPPNYVLSLQNTVATPQSITNTGTLNFGPTVVVALPDPDGYVLNSDILIQGGLNMPAGGGKINGNGYTITLGLNDIIPGTLFYTLTSSYLYNGKFKRWFKAGATTDFVSGGFPIGIISDIQPCAILMTTAPTTGGYITSEYITGYAGNLGLPLTVGSINVNRIYSYGYHRVIPDPSLAGYVYTFRMVGTNYYGVEDYQELVVLKRDDSTTPWTAPGTQGVPFGSNSQFTLSLIGLTSFSEFIVGGNDTPNPLPVFFKQFTLQRTQHQNYLSWIVENVQEIQNFEIQKSYDARQFSPVTIINLSNTSTYDYLDTSEPFTSKIFYRIKANLNNGQSVYSETLELNVSLQNDIQLYQNPVQNYLNLIVETDQEQMLKYQVFNLNGQKILEGNFDLKVGKQILTIETENYVRGMYILQTQLNQQTHSFKFAK